MVTTICILRDFKWFGGESRFSSSSLNFSVIKDGGGCSILERISRAQRKRKAFNLRSFSTFPLLRGSSRWYEFCSLINRLDSGLLAVTNKFRQRQLLIGFVGACYPIGSKLRSQNRSWQVSRSVVVSPKFSAIIASAKALLKSHQIFVEPPWDMNFRFKHKGIKYSHIAAL